MTTSIFRSFKPLAAVLLAAVLTASCGGGGSSAPAPTGLAVVAGDTLVTLTWDMVGDVEYWMFDGPSNVVPSSTANMSNWIGLPGGAAVAKVTSPLVVSSLTNGVSYTFSINGRIKGGPGGPGATPVTATPVAP